MNANDFFEKYSIETINKRTRISPISLRYIKNKEFKKIQRVKFIGFIRIIEKEFGIDLSDLIEEYNQATNHETKSPSENSEIKLQEPKKHNTFILFVLAVILFSLGAYLLYNKYALSQKNTNEINKTAFIPNTEENITDATTEIETKTENKNIIQPPSISEQTKQPVNENENRQITTDTNNSRQQKINAPETIYIHPNQKVWFRAINLDTNKTLEFLTSNPKTLEGSNWYIKFGHGNITVNYGNQTITPDTKKIVRILFHNGKVEYLKKPNRYEK